MEMPRERLPENVFFERESIGKILLKVAPPIMLAQLVQALYNIVDSYFIGGYADEGLTALSIMFPVQLLISALATGIGVGVNIEMSRLYALRELKKAEAAAGTGLVLGLAGWLLTAVLALLFMKPYVAGSVNSDLALRYGVTYGVMVSVGSFGTFLEGIWTNVHQSRGNMRRPMAAQIAGALINIVLDPILIFGLGPLPEMGIAGAALATVLGQVASAVITFRGAFYCPPRPEMLKRRTLSIWRLGFPSIVMKMMYVVYIAILNYILAGFSDEAVTVLGLYYKLQAFFVVPIMGMQPSVVPVLSYNFAQGRYQRCRKIMLHSVLLTAALMIPGVLCYELIPAEMLGLFTKNAAIITMGVIAFRWTGASFLPSVVTFLTPTFFQATNHARPSIFLAICRPILCLVPLFWLFSFIGLNYTWIAFPLAEVITGAIGLVMTLKMTKAWPALGPNEA